MIEQLRVKLGEVLESLGLEPSPIQLDRTKQPEHGDLATNVPLMRAGAAGRPPLSLAEEIVHRLQPELEQVQAVQVAAPGFINFTLDDIFLREHLRHILKRSSTYGRTALGVGKRAMVEFVSANPTGPLTVGHGRGAILGDTVSNILAWNGYEVEREYYYNDAGRQMRLLGESVRARYRELLGLDADFPEDGYEGEYIRDIAKALADRHGDSLSEEENSAPFTTAAEEAIFQDINGTLEQLGISFDRYFNEHDLYESGALEAVISSLEEGGFIYRKEGATWLRATRLGRDEDRVLIKSTGEPTYRLPDIAYHSDKLDRGYDLLVDIFGADHQATYPDVLAGLEGLGYNTARIRVLIHQFVTLTRGGQQVKMSTRKATFVTLDELMADVGRDVVRYFFMMRSMDTHLKFDLDLARTTSEDNPVYYLQYAHARMANIEKHAAAFDHQLDPGSAQLDRLELPEERALMVLLWWFPQVIAQAHETLEPQMIANFLQELATAYHKYYTVARVVTDDRPMTTARLVLTAACRQTLANGLQILGIAAPERM